MMESMMDERQSLGRVSLSAAAGVSEGQREDCVHLILSLGRKHPGGDAQGDDNREADEDAPPIRRCLVRALFESKSEGRATNPLAILDPSVVQELDM